MASIESNNFATAQAVKQCNSGEYEVPDEKDHGRDSPSKNHTVVITSDIDDIDTTTLSCADHGETASCHCEKCDMPVCIKCITGKHQGHKMVELNLNARLEKEKKLLQDDINKRKSDVLPKFQEKREEIEREKEMYAKKIDQIRNYMEAEHEDRIADLTRIHNDRMQNLTTIGDENLAKFDCYSKEILTNSIFFKESISKLEDAIKKSNIASMANLVKIINSLPEVQNTIKLPDLPSILPGNAHSVDDVLGKLNIPSPLLKVTTPNIVSQIKCPLQGTPLICFVRKNEKWLGGEKSRELVILTNRGSGYRRRKIQNRPFSLAAMDCGDIIISPQSDDSRSISRLMKDGREEHIYLVSPYGSCGVSVTADQKILICTVDGRVVRINGDGTNVKEIYKCSEKGRLIHAVENADGNIYISTCGRRQHAVVMVNKDGKVLSTITHTTKGELLTGIPWGLVVDKMDNILCADLTNVYIIHQNQYMKELVGSSHGIKEPSWLAVDNENNLWITQEDGTVHVVKYLSP